MKTDIEIANNVKIKNIENIAKKYNINKKYLINYGKNIAKVDLSIMNELKDKKDGKLILVTSTNPTPYGEGKTTMAIGLCDALNKIGKKTSLALREPSMGPVFGLKGGATGGGYAQVIPMENINLHFTGDIHAIEIANNLLCAIIDNHIYQGNELKIKKVLITRCMDLNDRSLREVKTKTREDSFCISVASEMMAIFCLAKDFKDLRNRIDNIIVGIDENDKLIYCKDLKATDALLIILKDAINPNIVQTLYGNLAFVHGGPFANIAHGTNSLIATNMALKVSDYVITEAGFGSDLGAEKYFDIVGKINNKFPDLVVINATIRSIKYHGSGDLEKGLSNLQAHIENMKLFSSNILVCINKFNDDKINEIKIVKKFVEEFNIKAVVSNAYSKGPKGAIELANEVIDILNNKNKTNVLYDNNESIKNKIEKIVKNIYHASNIIYSDKANDKIKELEQLKLDKYSICISKTPASLSDNPKVLGYPKDYDFNINDIIINNGAGFITVLSGSILRMPGLAKNSAYINMSIDDNKNIKGIY